MHSPPTKRAFVNSRCAQSASDPAVGARQAVPRRCEVRQGGMSRPRRGALASSRPSPPNESSTTRSLRGRCSRERTSSRWREARRATSGRSRMCGKALRSPCIGRRSKRVARRVRPPQAGDQRLEAAATPPHSRRRSSPTEKFVIAMPGTPSRSAMSKANPGMSANTSAGRRGAADATSAATRSSAAASIAA